MPTPQLPLVVLCPQSTCGRRDRSELKMRKMESTKVCVTGCSGYLGSWLVKRLLEKGYTVHATLKNLADASKVGLVKGLVPDHAQNKLRLFEADIYDAIGFKPAIDGCKYLFHMATPLQHDPKHTKFKDISEAAVSGLKTIVESCIKSGTVKRLIYTASVVAASPITDSGNGFKELMDESCWTPFNLSISYSTEDLLAYTYSKTLSEKEALKCNEYGELEVVTIACGLVGGDTLLATMPGSGATLCSQVTMNKGRYETLRFLEELLGKVPIVHIEDVTEAHILCMEKPSITGRFLCVGAYLSSAELASLWKKIYPQINIAEEFVEDSGREISLSTTKLKEIGFEYKYDVEMILDETLKCSQKLNELAACQK